MLKLYSIFHLNLLYSSIEIDAYPRVIRQCYWPLLQLVQKSQIPLGIELSGYTLEQIQKLDSQWVRLFKQLLKLKQVELIASGYCQIVGPLVPAMVNKINLKLGLQVYKKILGIRPQMALINEMAYSAGLVEHYLENRFKSVMMEWNNPRHSHPEWKNIWRYFPQQAVGANGKTVPLIWADSIAFQKFQRYAQGEMSLGDYMVYLLNHNAARTVRLFPLYTNDAEIFDFRPERYKTEPHLKKEEEWERISYLFEVLKNTPQVQLIFPSKVLEGFKLPQGNHSLILGSPEQPIPVKKQEKYNIIRWALTGRDDLNINTQCYRIFESFKLTGKKYNSDWKKLCFLWASDFRTHITEKRWNQYHQVLHSLYTKRSTPFLLKKKERFKEIHLPFTRRQIDIKEENSFLSFENREIKILFNRNKGFTIDRLWFKKVSQEPLLGTLKHGYYDDITLGADFFSGHTIIEKPGEHKITDLTQMRPTYFWDSIQQVFKIQIYCKFGLTRFQNEIYLFPNSLLIRKILFLPQRYFAKIHPLNITFIPTSWDQKSLFYATHNGGHSEEKYPLHQRFVEHFESVSPLISAKSGLGATEGKVWVGDKRKTLCFEHERTVSALIPSIYYRALKGEPCFLRLEYSAQEMDDTFVENQHPQIISCSIRISSKTR